MWVYMTHFRECSDALPLYIEDVNSFNNNFHLLLKEQGNILVFFVVKSCLLEV
jgi:hypothetical protein